MMIEAPSIGSDCGCIVVSRYVHHVQGLNATDIIADIGQAGGLPWNQSLAPSANAPASGDRTDSQRVLDCLVLEGRAVGQAAPQFALAALQALLNTKGYVASPPNISHLLPGAICDCKSSSPCPTQLLPPRADVSQKHIVTGLFQNITTLPELLLTFITLIRHSKQKCIIKGSRPWQQQQGRDQWYWVVYIDC